MSDITEDLGFQPSDLIDQVTEIIDKEIEACVHNLSREVLKSNEGKRKDNGLSEGALEKVSGVVERKVLQT